MRIAIISHTEHYKDASRHLTGWGPTIRELNFLAETDEIEEIVHLAPLHNLQPPKSSMPYESPKMTFIALKPAGGQGLQKLSLLYTMPYNIKLIHRYAAKADWVQFRAPTGMGLFVLPYLALIRQTHYWVKYAGNWVDPNMPLGNKLQKLWLKYIARCQVTINGHWEKQQRMMSFENPSMSQTELGELQDSLKHKSNPTQKGWSLIFVGALNQHKGVHLILDALSKISEQESKHIAQVVFVGDGPERQNFEQRASKLQVKCKFMGFLDKPGVFSELKKAHALILPSKSEGFPKVLGEAMAAGSVPIVSDVSCLSEYVQSGENGFVLEKINADSIYLALKHLFCIDYEHYKQIMVSNQSKADCFTYEYYNQQLFDLIFDL